LVRYGVRVAASAARTTATAIGTGLAIGWNDERA
jgi:hypothetical protein